MDNLSIKVFYKKAGWNMIKDTPQMHLCIVCALLVYYLCRKIAY